MDKNKWTSLLCSESIVHTYMWIRGQEITIVDYVKKTIHKVKNIEQIQEPKFQLVMSLLSPLLLEEILQGQWVFKHFKRQEDCEWGILDVINPEEKTCIEITINMSASLPVKSIPVDP